MEERQPLIQSVSKMASQSKSQSKGGLRSIPHVKRLKETQELAGRIEVVFEEAREKHRRWKEHTSCSGVKLGEAKYREAEGAFNAFLQEYGKIKCHDDSILHKVDKSFGRCSCEKDCDIESIKSRLQLYREEVGLWAKELQIWETESKRSVEDLYKELQEKRAKWENSSKSPDDQLFKEVKQRGRILHQKLESELLQNTSEKLEPIWQKIKDLHALWKETPEYDELLEGEGQRCCCSFSRKYKKIWSTDSQLQLNLSHDIIGCLQPCIIQKGVDRIKKMDKMLENEYHFAPDYFSYGPS